MKLLFGHDKEVADWASKKFGTPLRNWYYAVGVLNEAGVLVGAGTFHDMNGTNIEFCFWGPGASSPTVIRGMMAFAFEYLKVCRVTARTPRQNRVVIKHLPRYGFKVEGVAKHYYGPVKRLDAIMFGLLAGDAKKILEGRT